MEGERNGHLQDKVSSAHQRGDSGIFCRRSPKGFKLTRVTKRGESCGLEAGNSPDLRGAGHLRDKRPGARRMSAHLWLFSPALCGSSHRKQITRRVQVRQARAVRKGRVGENGGVGVRMEVQGVGMDVPAERVATSCRWG